jgi:DNA end-binding protein Ku
MRLEGISHMATKSAAEVAAELKDAQDGGASVLSEPAKGHCSRSSAKFIIQAFGVMNIPAASYKATDADKIESHMYHNAKCASEKKRLKQEYKCECGEKVENAKTNSVKGVEVGDKIVLLTQAELDAQKPINDKVLKITSFVPAESINPIYYESSEYLAADKGGEKGFATLQQALANKDRVAIGTFVSRGHQYSVAIRAYGQYGLVMSYLFAEYEVRECGKWKPVATVQAEVALCETLMTETELAKDTFTAAAYDPFLRNCRNLIAKKAAGETVNPVECEAAPAGGTDDLFNALNEMLNQQKAKAAAGSK